MKKIILSLLMLCLSATVSIATTHFANNTTAQQASSAEIKFDTLRASVGTFPSSKPIQKCQFRFTNIGSAPLILNQVFASCGCTIPNYPKTPIKPGESSVIEVTYNGTNKFPGKFAKTITVRSNASNEIVRLTVEGTMTE